MKLKRRRRRVVTPINAMSDIAFLLLIFIMLISLINYRREIKIDFAEAFEQEAVNADSNLELWIDAEGGIFYDGERIDTTAAENIVIEAINENPKTRIHILADRGARYRHVNSLVEVLQFLQHRTVSFVVKEPES